MKYKEKCAMPLDSSLKPITITYNSDDICCRCGAMNGDLELTAYYSEDPFCRNIFLIDYCQHCNHLSLKEFHITHMANYSNEKSDLIGITPIRFPMPAKQSNFSKEINEKYPSFVKIYHQAEIAEQHALNELSGMGYRKALEFIIKEFAVSLFPNDKTKISEEPLSKTINRFSDDELKTFAMSSAWIANDYCHYCKKHDAYTLEHLKTFIFYVVSLIEKNFFFNLGKQILSKGNNS